MLIQHKLTPLRIVIISTVVILFNITVPLTAIAETGLDFPGNGNGAVRFQFVNPQNNGLPIYGPSGRGVTYIWKVYTRKQASYYTTFFWGNEGDFWWDSGTPNTFYGFHPWPNGSGHCWEIATYQGADICDDPNITEWNVWRTQAARVWSDGSGKHTIFYWELPRTDSAHTVSYTCPTSYGNTNPPNPVLAWGNAQWSHVNDEEVYDGIIRAIAIYNKALSVNDMLAEANSPLSTAEGNANIWYMNLNPTPNDISDKSGKGHHPVWVGSKRPALYTSGSSETPAPPTNLHIID